MSMDATHRSEADTPPNGVTRRATWGAAVLFGLTLLLWVFPKAWYTRADAAQKFVWFREQTNLVGWVYREIPVAESAESALVADQLVSGEFRRDPTADAIRVFSAKRYSEKPHDIGLFVHTPDRCWTEAGWRIEPVSPDAVEVEVHGVKLVLERRIFGHGALRELVYFGGLVGGQPLPYRLDHNLSVGMRSALRAAVRTTGGSLRASDTLFWQRVWESFTARRQLLGPKQFIRVSTSALTVDLTKTDRALTEFLQQWLQPVDYEQEIREGRGKRG